ncbi:MAG TPA: ATP-binding cassette domain-containing protein [Thermoanaerobaculia bacterium]|nr:ATP-binding cassette domain-containing protein [Thermoanaerobaculia bacterium]
MTLQLDAVRKSYGANEVLRGFTGTFARGRIAALIGPNGAGKTTLLRIAAGLQHADGGTVSRAQVLYYGGFDTMPARGTIDAFRSALGLQRASDTRKLAKLSRGELQRVGLAAALELPSDALLLDEPWTALEPDARDELNGALQRIATDRIVVCSTHDLDQVARIADDFVFLAAGTAVWKKREDGGITRDELLRLYHESKSR